MLEREYEYYKARREELVDRYIGKFVVIVGESVVGAFDSISEAYFASMAKYQPGTFLIQEIVADEEKLVRKFYSRVNG